MKKQKIRSAKLSVTMQNIRCVALTNKSTQTAGDAVPVNQAVQRLVIYNVSALKTNIIYWQVVAIKSTNIICKNKVKIN